MGVMAEATRKYVLGKEKSSYFVEGFIPDPDMANWESLYPVLIAS